MAPFDRLIGELELVLEEENPENKRQLKITRKIRHFTVSKETYKVADLKGATTYFDNFTESE